MDGYVSKPIVTEQFLATIHCAATGFGKPRWVTMLNFGGLAITFDIDAVLARTGGDSIGSVGKGGAF